MTRLRPQLDVIDKGEGLNEKGRLCLTHTRLKDRFVLRRCVGQTHTDQSRVKAAAALEGQS